MKGDWKKERGSVHYTFINRRNRNMPLKAPEDLYSLWQFARMFEDKQRQKINEYRLEFRS